MRSAPTWAMLSRVTVLDAQPPAILLTDGVVTLRPIDGCDVDQITAACQDDRLQQYIPVPRPYRRTDAEAYVELARRLWTTGRKAVFSVVDPEDHGRLLGVISITLAGRCGNAAYWVAAGERGRGVGRRALRLLADWAFSALDLAVVLLEIHETNLASAAVAEAAGFRHSGRVDVETAAGPRFALLYVRLASDAVTDPGPGG